MTDTRQWAGPSCWRGRGSQTKVPGGGRPAGTGAEVAPRPRASRSRPADMSGDAGPGGREGAPRAAATLCGLYHEAGQQLRRLQEQLAARDALIERLRARLAALEGDAAPSLVDALLEQVARFREQLRQREGGAGAVEAALRQVRPPAGAGRGCGCGCVMGAGPVEASGACLRPGELPGIVGGRVVQDVVLSFLPDGHLPPGALPVPWRAPLLSRPPSRLHPLVSAPSLPVLAFILSLTSAGR